MTDSPNENLQSLPQDAEALHALVLATLAERDAAVTTHTGAKSHMPCWAHECMFAVRPVCRFP